jgi:cell division protein FtsB
MPLPIHVRSRLALGIAVVIALVAGGGIVWGFGQQIVRAREMRAEEIRLERAVAAAQERHEALVAELEYVRSDEYPEEWARAERHLGRPGDVVVIVVDEPDLEPTAEPWPTPTPEPKPESWWLEWWELIFSPPDR